MIEDKSHIIGLSDEDSELNKQIMEERFRKLDERIAKNSRYVRCAKRAFAEKMIKFEDVLYNNFLTEESQVKEYE